MAIITVSGEFGTEGRYVAVYVAKALNYHFVDKDVMERVALEYGYTEFEAVYEAKPDLLAKFDERQAELVQGLDKVNLALARHGNCVILEGGAFAVLGGFSDVLNVRIQASIRARVQWAMEHHEFSDPVKAEAFVSEHDKARAAFVDYYYKVRWDSARAFDLSVDTDKVSPELAARWIVEAHEELVTTKRNPLGQRSASNLQVDRILADAVNEALGCNLTH